MKNKQNGSVLVVVLIIILIGIAGVLYWYILQNQKNSSLSDIAISSSQGLSWDILKINSPTSADILVPGQSFTVSFTPFDGASKYVITISEPLLLTPVEPFRGGGLVSPDKRKILFQATTTNSSYTLVVPNSQYSYQTESSYNGGMLIVSAVDSQGRQLSVTSNLKYNGKTVKTNTPITNSQQIKILPLPNHPELLDADKYVLDNQGGIVNLKFGALAAPNKTREIILMCYFEKGQVSIGTTTCPDGVFDAGQAAFTKKVIVKPNPFKDRDTSFAIRVRYYDAAGKTDDYGLHESLLSIKIKK